jgi:hypothetical protein
MRLVLVIPPAFIILSWVFVLVDVIPPAFSILSWVSVLVPVPLVVLILS